MNVQTSEPRATISACIISFNEEKNIGPCVESVSWCDEVVVVDSFSLDATAEIARGHGAIVQQEKWRGHVAQKNLAVEAASSDWVLALDCDERVTPRLRAAILEKLRDPGDIDGFLISRKLHYMGRWLQHGGWFPEWRLRLFRRDRGRWGGVDPHDTVRITGKTARIDYGSGDKDAEVIQHYSFRDLSHQLKVLDRYTEIQKGELVQAGRRAGWSDLVFRPLARFLLTYVARGGFLDGAAGYHMAVNHAYAAYKKYAKLWEVQQGLSSTTSKSELVPGMQEGEGSTKQ